MARPPTSLPPSTSSPLNITLLLGSFVHPPAKIELFKLVVPPSQPALAHAEEPFFHPLPEIHHTFRADPKTPPRLLSLVFSAIVVAPWVVLLGLVRISKHCTGVYGYIDNMLQWGYIQPKVPQLFSLNVLPFILNLAAFEGLLLWYWVDLKIGQVLAYGAVLGLFTAAAGNRALSAISKQRLRK